MARFLFGFLSISFSFLLLASPILSDLNGDINWWCNQTPHPEPCKHFMGHLEPKHKAEFRQMAVQTALDRALVAHNHTQELGPKCQNELEKAAWIDCLTLYESTIIELNRTLNPTSKGCTEFDTQTWLSTALTNLETCKAGFVELGVPDFIPPLMSNNVSKLISNGLAMHNNAITPETQYEEGFPTWVTKHDRKLLQTSTIAANLVVAQDGSGNYKTITEALSAASKRTGSGRFVIHVKSGVYAEYLVIGKNLKNIMLTGDGMGSTIITGSRSNGGGFTTFNSATVGKQTSCCFLYITLFCHILYALIDPLTLP